jgi:hypothetical protein
MERWIKMIEYIASQIENLSREARDTYGVNPIIFLAIYLSSVPVFYYSLIRSVQAIAKNRSNEIILWSTIFLCATIAPFLYVLIFGKNLPWWVYLIIALLAGQGVLSFVKQLGKKPEKEANRTPK